MKKRAKYRAKLVIAFLWIGLIGITIYNLYTMYINIEIKNPNYETKKLVASANNIENFENSDRYNETQEDMLENVIESVVGISRLTSTGGSILNNVSAEDLGIGTGIVVSEDGYILSNTHVTGDKFSTCYVTIEDKYTYKGTVVWADTSLDLSLVKINASNLVSINIGDSETTRVGETVYAIGNPVGFQFRRTVTSGIVSALNRTVKLQEDGNDIYMSDLIQTDATINPGNSGGPLINIDGKVIGINSVKITTAEGIGFAVPIDVVKPVIESFANKGSFDEATLGLLVYDESVSRYMNLNNRFSSGIYIYQIIKGGAADGKGIKEGDIITKIGDKYLNTINDLRQYIYSKNPGDRVTLNINKGKYTKDIDVILGKK